MSRPDSVPLAALRRAIAKTISETELQNHITELARTLGWSTYHTHDSRRSPAGFPDLVLAHPRLGIIFAELKSETGSVKAEQKNWIALLAAAGADVYLWRPSDLTDIVDVLRRGQRRL